MSNPVDIAHACAQGYLWREFGDLSLIVEHPFVTPATVLAQPGAPGRQRYKSSCLKRAQRDTVTLRVSRLRILPAQAHPIPARKRCQYSHPDTGKDAART